MSAKPGYSPAAPMARKQLRITLTGDSAQAHAGGGGEDANPLRSIRRQSYLTQQEVAERLGVSQRRVSEIERADIASLQIGTLNRYLDALGSKLHIVVVSDR